MGRFLKLKYYTPTQKASLALLSVVEVVKDAGRNQGAGESTGLHYGGEANGGGVYHSKRTKTKAENSELGMLIVHGMGLEMLDLVVASNLVALMRKWDKWAKERRAVGY